MPVLPPPGKVRLTYCYLCQSLSRQSYPPIKYFQFYCLPLSNSIRVLCVQILSLQIKIFVINEKSNFTLLLQMTRFNGNMNLILLVFSLGLTLNVAGEVYF
jgi:hypothetical protein